MTKGNFSHLVGNIMFFVVFPNMSSHEKDLLINPHILTEFATHQSKRAFGFGVGFISRVLRFGCGCDIRRVLVQCSVLFGSGGQRLHSLPIVFPPSSSLRGNMHFPGAAKCMFLTGPPTQHLQQISLKTRLTMRASRLEVLKCTCQGQQIHLVPVGPVVFP